MIICSRCSDLKVPYTKSVLRYCCKCSEPVWAANSTLADAKEIFGEKFDIICSLCAPAGPTQTPSLQTRKELDKMGMTSLDIELAKVSVERFLNRPR